MRKKKPATKISKQLFEKLFFDRLGQTPSDFITTKIAAGSDVKSTKYLFTITAAAIAQKCNCEARDFNEYYKPTQKTDGRTSMKSGSFSFDGGKLLTQIGATWFVSYAYYERIDKAHKNWSKVSTAQTRISNYYKGKKYHTLWLQEIEKMDPERLNTNTIGLSAEQTKQMARDILSANAKSHKVIKYNKLVRDRIPEIIKASGKSCEVDTLDNDRYITMLDAKLQEELNEYQESKSLEELADLLEVMGAVVKARGYTWEQLTEIRKEKKEKRGGFEKRLLLKEVVEN